MVERRNQNPADAFKYYTDLINTEIAKLEECLASIKDYSEKLHNVAGETQRRLTGRS